MEYEHLISTRSRSLRLRIASDGHVIVSTPPRTPQRVIDDFVTAHEAWITNAQAHLEKRPRPVQKDKVMVFGTWYNLDIHRELTAQTGVHLEKDQLVIAPSDPKASGEAVTKIITRFIKTTAEKYIIPRTHQWAGVMGIEFHAISLREQKTRWGSCSSRGNLQFNWRLVHYPAEVIDYVIIHELAHRRQMNHSAAFWNIVKTYDPAYLEHRGWLKRNGFSEG